MITSSILTLRCFTSRRPYLIVAENRYGDRMDELWGEFAPVPEERVNVLDGGEPLELGGRRIEVAYTPGHAVHHVSYLDTATGAAYVGDTAGIRVEDLPYALPVTPPPRHRPGGVARELGDDPRVAALELAPDPLRADLLSRRASRRARDAYDAVGRHRRRGPGRRR